MRENRPSGSEGGGAGVNRLSLPLLGNDALRIPPSPLYSGERAGVRGSGCLAAIRPLTPDPSPP